MDRHRRETKQPPHNIQLVTGASGFIGRHLVESLHRSGKSVRTLSRSVAGKHAIEGVENVTVDVMDSAALHHAMQGVDVVFHLAGYGSPSSRHEDVEDMYKVNVVGMHNVLNAARDAGVRRVIITSSASVYGHLDADAISESSPLVPSSPYGLTKVAQEQACQMYSREFGIQSVALRLFNVYGAGEDMSDANSKLIPSVFRRVQRNQPIQVFGDGKQTRDFIHISDVVSALERSAEVEIDGYLVMNIGTGVGTPIDQVIRKLEELLRTQATWDLQPLRSRETLHSVADVTLARANGIHANVPLEEGIFSILDTED